MRVVLQVSDTHFVTEQPVIVEPLLWLVHVQCFTRLGQATIGLMKSGESA
jgi:hypothetical protein